jgi:MerR family transcriptional regulator, light-induced transcriptional regulator
MAVPETYLKTQQVADALGVSASTVKRWVDAGAIEATRTIGKHRLVTLSSALRFARQERLAVDGLPTMAGQSPFVGINEHSIQSLVDALKNGRNLEARQLISTVYQCNTGAVALADQFIRPAMERVGHGWSSGTWDIYEEHSATQTVASAVNDLINQFASEFDGTKPLALGAAPEGDLYVLPGLLGELVLRELGWEVMNLSNNLPLRSLAKATYEHRPRLVFLSVSFIQDRDQFLREYSSFYEAASQVGAAIMLGGRGLDLGLRSNLIYASYGERMAHLAEFALRLVPAAAISPARASIKKTP